MILRTNCILFVGGMFISSVNPIVLFPRICQLWSVGSTNQLAATGGLMFPNTVLQKMPTDTLKADWLSV